MVSLFVVEILRHTLRRILRRWVLTAIPTRSPFLLERDFVSVPLFYSMGRSY